MSRVGFLLLIVVGLLVFATGERGSKAPAEVTPAKTPEQIAADNRKEAAFQRVVAALQIIKKANRNPASVTWETIMANDDASVICIEYRGQNGFGGMNKEFVVIAKGSASQKPSAWNRHCAGKPLQDFIYARQAL